MSGILPSGDGHAAVCGGGLIGTSLALAIAGAGGKVRVHDRDAQVRADLRDVIAAAGRTGVAVLDEWSEAAAGASLVVAAVPPPAVPGVIAAGSAVAQPDALLIDVAGVKASVVEALRAKVESDGDVMSRFVGSHPMAGSERSGPRAADAALFTAATWILTPTTETSDLSLAVASDLVRDLGARVLVLSPEEHDAIVGLVSHLPQLVASVLADVAAEAVGSERDAVMAVAGPGFRDTTRIAASDTDLWLDIIAGNRASVAAALSAFRDRLEEVLAAIDADDAERLGAILRRAGDARRRLVPKGVDEATRHLVVPLRDRPGEIARITGALGSAGINIEDLAMRHATAADRGSLVLRVRETAAGRALDALDASGVEGAVVEREHADGGHGA